MDAAAFGLVYQDFQEFHAYFAPLFGRRETRERSGIICRPGWCNPGSGATRRTCRRLSPSRPGECSGFSATLPGTMRRL